MQSLNAGIGQAGAHDAAMDMHDRSPTWVLSILRERAA
jgi:hypothetical protein